MPEPLVIGSRNPKKAAELAELLADLPWDVKGIGDFPELPEPEEDGETFEANAIKKALYYADRLRVWSVGDDSGLVVDALGGAPGVRSARYAGPACRDTDNCAKLLAALALVPEGQRTARFVCCAALARPGQVVRVEFGTVEGHMGTVCRGRMGFGYDPLFVPEGFQETFAEMEPAAKHAISHRGQAFHKLRAFLTQWAPGAGTAGDGKGIRRAESEKGG